MLARLRAASLFSLTRGMSRSSNTLDVSPPVHRGMAVLDKAAFRKSVPILAVKVPPEAISTFLSSKVLKNALLNVRKVKSVTPAEDGGRLVLLRVQNQTDLSPEASELIEKQNAELVPYTLEFDYDYWLADEILHSVLPEDLVQGAPSGFAAMGHIAHLNLTDEYLPYKHLIGQVILEKNLQVKTVVNKVNTISNQFRVFPMELLAGEPNYVVEHHESDCTFTFDFSQVYWNSRLQTEHARLVEQFSPTDVVADVFAGVGPFSIPAAKRGCAVLANDLNPVSYKYLVQNIANNKVSTFVRPSCKDGREFIREVFNAAYDDDLPPAPRPKISRSKAKELNKQARVAGTQKTALPPSTSVSPRRRITQFAMNLPATAIEFLDAFRGVLAPNNAGERPMRELYDAPERMPMVHCYCFTKELEPELADVDIRRRVEEVLGAPLGEETSTYLVRSVAPNKEMYCISFRLPYEVAFAA